MAKDLKKRDTGSELANINYVEYTDEDAAVAKRQADKDEESVVFRKWPVGKTVFRVLPKLAGATWGVGSQPYMKIFQHGLKTTDGKFIATECTWRGRPVSDRSPCPICEHGNTLSRSANPVDQAAAKDYWAKPSMFFNAVIRPSSGNPEDAVVNLFQVNTKSIIMAIEALRNPPEDFDASDGEVAVYGNFSSPTAKGFDIIVRRKGTTVNNTEYTVTPSSFKPLGEEYAHLIADQYDPRQYTRILPAVAMKALIDGIDEEDFKALLKKSGKQSRAADDDDDEPPRSTRFKRDNKVTPRGKVVDDIEDVDVEDDD